MDVCILAHWYHETCDTHSCGRWHGQRARRNALHTSRCVCEHTGRLHHTSRQCCYLCACMCVCLCAIGENACKSTLKHVFHAEYTHSHTSIIAPPHATTTLPITHNTHAAKTGYTIMHTHRASRVCPSAVPSMYTSQSHSPFKKLSNTDITGHKPLTLLHRYFPEARELALLCRPALLHQGCEEGGGVEQCNGGFWGEKVIVKGPVLVLNRSDDALARAHAAGLHMSRSHVLLCD